MLASHFAEEEFVMDRVSVDLKNCYGIKALKYDFDFSQTNAFAIYAPNGAMKSSFALTFKDLSTGAKPKDRIFPDRPTSASVLDENGDSIENDCSATIWMRVRVASFRNVPERSVVASHKMLPTGP